MDPYEKTAQVMKKQAETPKRVAKGLAGTASLAGSAAFAPLLARAAPFLSEFIPTDLAIKGLTKVNPKLGKFVQDAMNSGFDFDEAKNFLGEQIMASQQHAKQEKNIIEQYSPDLHQFISEQIGQGRNAYQAGAIAQKDKRFVNAIQKLTKDHKISWADIIEQVYGQNPTVKKKPGLVEQERERFNEAYGGQQQPQQGLDPAVAQILQQGAQILQRFQGQ